MSNVVRDYMLARCEDLLTVELMLQLVCQQLPDATPGIIVEVMARIFELPEEEDTVMML